MASKKEETRVASEQASESLIYDQLIASCRADNTLNEVVVEIEIHDRSAWTWSRLARKDCALLDSFEKLVRFVKRECWDGTDQEFCWIMYHQGRRVQGDKFRLLRDSARVSSNATKLSYNEWIEKLRGKNKVVPDSVDVIIDQDLGTSVRERVARRPAAELDTIEKLQDFVKTFHWDGSAQDFRWEIRDMGRRCASGSLCFEVNILRLVLSKTQQTGLPLGDMLLLLRNKGALETTKALVYRLTSHQNNLEEVVCSKVDSALSMVARIRSLFWDGEAATFGWSIEFEGKESKGWVPFPKNHERKQEWSMMRTAAELARQEVLASLPGIPPEQVDYSQQVFSVSVPPGQAPRMDGVRQPIQLGSAESVPAPQPPSEPTIGGLSLDQARTMMYLADLHSWLPDGALPKGGSINRLIADGLVVDRGHWPLTERGQAWVQAYGDAVPRKRLPFLLVLGDQEGPLMIREVLLNDLERETLEGPVAEMHKAEGRTISLIEQEKQPVLEGDLAVAEWLKAATTPMNREDVVAIASIFTVPAAVFRSKEGQAQTLGSGFYPDAAANSSGAVPRPSGRG